MFVVNPNLKLMFSIRLTMVERLWLLLDSSARSLCSITCSLPEYCTTEYMPWKTRLGGEGVAHRRDKWHLQRRELTLFLELRQRSE